MRVRRRSAWLPSVLACAVSACGADDGRRDPAFSLDTGEPSTTADPQTGSAPADDGAGTLDAADGTTSAGATGASGDDTDSGGIGSDGESTGVQNDCPRVQIDVGAGMTLNVRPDPSTMGAPVGSLADGAIIDVLGEEVGEDVDGNALWYHVQNAQLEGFISATFAVCTSQEPPEIDEDGWYMPLPCAMTATVSQGNNGATSHTGTSLYAFDFAVPLNTPLVAMASGTVAYTFDETGPGDPCYNGGDSSCSNFANYVVLLHADGTRTSYRHLNQVDVAVGDVVGIGTPVGLSGSTGWSTGRHAHVMRTEDCGSSYCQSIPLAFNDAPEDGVPVTGDTVTSGNCP